MKCKCGQKAELQQQNIFEEVEHLCRDCFNSLGHHDDRPEYEDGLFYASRMGKITGLKPELTIFEEVTE